MAGHFVRLLRGIATDPDAPIGLVPLMTEVEQAQVVGMGERRDASSPASDRRGTSPRTTLHELFQAQARRTPDAVALESAPGAEKLTYRQLQAHASALARRLSAAGIGTGDRVGVSIERSAEALIAMLGILQAAAAFVPLDPAAPPARLAALAGDCRLSAIVVRDAVPATVAGCPVVAVRGDAIVDAPQATATADDPAYVLYTSGSSGAPGRCDGRASLAGQLLSGGDPPLRGDASRSCAAVRPAHVRRVPGGDLSDVARGRHGGPAIRRDAGQRPALRR
jgi:nonribosomal peptide synthetase CepB